MGVVEDGEWTECDEGSPQGASVSPLLANVYLHYVFDLWVEAWRKKVARGQVVVVRYADDLVVGFQSKAEAERLGVFGAPTFFVGDQMFWGQDRLDFVKEAIQ